MQSYAGAILLGRGGQVPQSFAVDPTEDRLIERCKKGDDVAFGQFVDLYQSRVFGFVKRMVGTSEEAEDVTQEVFIRAYQHIKRFDSRCTIKTWIFRIAHNLCIDSSRRTKRTIQGTSSIGDGVEEESVAIADESWSPENMVIHAQLLEVVEEAIEAMSDKLREVLLLHDREDLAYDEIATMLEIPEGTVKSRLFLARNFLQSKVSHYLANSAGERV